MSNPKLALIPSGYKSGKVYSILPNDASGDFDFTRQSIGTRVRKDGLIEEAKTVGSITNELLYSEDYSQSQWSKIRSTISTDQTLAPDGTNTADKIIPTADNNTHRCDQVITLTNNAVYTLSFYVKEGGYNCIRASIGQSSLTFGSLASFNLNTETVSITGTVRDAQIQSIANDWYRCSITMDAGSTDRIVIGLGNNNSYSFAGDTTSGIFMWGAMVSEGALSDYIKTEGTTETKRVETFTDVPRLDWLNSNCPCLLLEPERTNYATNNTSMDTYSNSVFGNNPNPTQTADYTIAPDGTLTATRLQTSKTGTNYSLISFPTTSNDGSGGGYYTASVYVKSNTGSSQTIGFYGANSAPNTRTATTEWTRIQFTGQRLGNTKYAYLGAINGTDDDIDISVWGAQIELVDSYPSSLIYTEASTVTRLADVCSVTTPSGVKEIVETFLDDTTNTITTIPSTYTISEGKIKKVIMT